MAQEFKLQDPGEGIHEVEVQEILVSPGDSVEDGDTAFVVESDKAAIELPSPYRGTVKDIPVNVGDTVRVGDVLMTVEGGAGKAKAEEDTAKKPAPDTKPEAKAATSAAPAAPAAPSASAPASAAAPGGPVKAAPAARKLAKEKGLDIAEVPASGKKGHVTRADVERFAAGGAAGPSAGARAAEPLPDFAQFGPVRREPLRSIRKATARHMAKAWAEIPHVMLEDRLDLTALERFRKRHAEAVRTEGGQLTLTVFVIKALAAALKRHPRFNASIDMAREEIIEKDYINVGMALDSERGLIVPVLRDADTMSVFELAVAVRELAERVRSGQASKEDLSGGTISLTNVGALGGTGFFPVINHPEVAILGMGRGQVEPVVIGDLDHYHVEARYIVPLSLSFDHRVNDGADAARFLADIRKILTDPEQFVLHG